MRDWWSKGRGLHSVDTPFLTDLETQTSPVEHSVILHIVLVQKFQSLGCEPCLRTSGLFCALPRFANQAPFSLFSRPEGRERSRRSSLSGRRLRFVGSFSTIASNPVDIPQALWTRGRRLNRSEDLIDRQPVFHSLPPVVRRRPRKHSVSEQRLPEQWVTPSEDNRTEVSIVAIEIDIPVSRMDQQNTSGMEALMRQMQESMRQMQEDAARQAEFSKLQAAIMAQQAELITRLQQQNAASTSHQVPPPQGAPLPEQAPTVQNALPNTQNTVPNVQNMQEDMNLPTGPALPPLPPQLSKAHTPNHPDSPFEFEIDHTSLKLSKLEKLFKKSQGVKAIPDIEDGYTDVAVTLPDRFKMPQIDRFDGSGDPMVHLRLFSDILRPMGLTRPQKLSLFGRTLSGVAAIWYAKL
ncbi:hypothetical protein HYC85_029932 [Camellia sinensis]|uniref:Retrotransposon gag domain-containing protein n=1 Tax=Camellia sinensis TaxID=4442 RepID=A0A7J7G0N3_CAMSI|nr:hypothetical protein HYC85_029932 [Camellia sinensis]